MKNLTPQIVNKAVGFGSSLRSAHVDVGCLSPHRSVIVCRIIDPLLWIVIHSSSEGVPGVTHHVSKIDVSGSNRSNSLLSKVGRASCGNLQKGCKIPPYR